ncbi:glycosyltransferase family 2 protein [Marinobacter mangrovi]|uniref:glycosyltransferase family 2 protein n=1 Tax=Marinobacter mangrovi TaxID=2803918 RepID=UPI001933F5AD|nr:glycosyltransferase family 2 protein [Marinobacter mangrovi]
MTESPQISVIVPCYNSADTILRSLQSALSQRGVTVEVVVVDDGSSDGTAEILKEINDDRLRYVFQQNSGPSVARNKGVSASSGDYVAFLDADDEWHQHKLLKQFEYMSQHDLVASICDVEEQVPGSPATVYRKPQLRDKREEEIVDLIYRGKVTRNTPTMMIKRSAFTNVSGFDESLRNREDHHLLCKLASVGRMGTLPEPLTIRHVVMSSYSRSYNALRYYSDTLLFHKKMHTTFPYLDVVSGVRRTKVQSVKRALRSYSISSVLKIVFDRTWKKVIEL